MRDRISVVVVDDHSLFRAGVIQSLLLDDGIEVVGEGGSGPDAVRLVSTLEPDVALVDISMPGNGIEAAAEIARRRCGTRVVMLTVSEEDDDVLRSLEAGAVGYILKGVGAADLVLAVKSVAAGHSFVSPNLALRLLTTRKPRRDSRLSLLSPQEKRTLRLVAMGLSNREAGQRMGVLEKTVKFHMSSILNKLGARNRVEASMMAREEWGEAGDDQAEAPVKVNQQD